MALRRAMSFDRNLRSNPIKCKQVVDFMDKLLVNHHAELAPELPAVSERWYLPMFAVHHPKKPESVRVVFDSSAKYKDSSLNSVLLQGPDILNNLLGILLRFRKDKVAATMDVEHMFYNFKVPEKHRCYLRFLWHQNNDIDQPLIEYQMTRHVFGNCTSPSIANYGFRKIVEGADKDVQDLINENFYVDDGLVSCKTVDQTFDLVLRTQQTLQDRGRVRLHKFASNSRHVLNALDQADLAKNLKDLDLGTATLPTQRSLGLLWNTESDSFIFSVNQVEKPYTRRGLSSTINSVFDLIGFVQPVVIEGKILLREMMSVTKKTDWDDPLPEALHDKWVSWIHSLACLEELHIPRMYSDISFEDAIRREVLVFADASKNAIAASAYLKLYDVNRSTISFLMGKAKVAPNHGHPIPRYELCAAVLATEIAESIAEQLSTHKDNFSFFMDSQVVLGYISNESTRGLYASHLSGSLWLNCPEDTLDVVSDTGYGLVNPEQDVEIRLEVTCALQSVEIKDIAKPGVPFSDFFSRFSSWNKLLRVIVRIKFWVCRHRKDGHSPTRFDDPELLRNSELPIIACVQRDIFAEEISCIKDRNRIPRNSPLKSLSPVITNCVLRIGGRLNNALNTDITEHFCNPIILPKNHHITRLVIRHYHHETYHQGRHFTEGHSLTLPLPLTLCWILGNRNEENDFCRDQPMCGVSQITQ
ncbi:uncharacterized protein LOC130048781 [Ostrea edulis]|uniref:uncharacterized protein LOC130048781 n=1 Tax=Ostrea edulis TaxID=37623 RepID=UPI0024AF5BC9|nr:uncharacterized protein LOC130048781 [Ostrea edulis]